MGRESVSGATLAESAVPSGFADTVVQSRKGGTPRAVSSVGRAPALQAPFGEAGFSALQSGKRPLKGRNRPPDIRHDQARFGWIPPHEHPFGANRHGDSATGRMRSAIPAWHSHPGFKALTRCPKEVASPSPAGRGLSRRQDDFALTGKGIQFADRTHQYEDPSSADRARGSGGACTARRSRHPRRRRHRIGPRRHRDHCSR